jgi:nitroreductase
MQFAELADARRSIRSYLPTDVSDQKVRQLLSVARQAPSGANLQPGHFLRVRGARRARLTEELVGAWREGKQEEEDYGYFPRPMPMSLRKRQVASAQALYGALGVERGDRVGRDEQFERNFCFFDAPVALIVTLERGFGSGGYMDLGMTLYGLMLAARAQGLDSCAIGAMASFPRLIRRSLELDEDQAIVCGVALGHADPQAPVNQCRTARCDPEDYFRTLG